MLIPCAVIIVVLSEMTSKAFSDVRAGVGVVRALQPGDPQLIGPYRLVGQLGHGGMGRVFLGVSAGGRPVAVKIIRSELAAIRISGRGSARRSPRHGG